MSTVAQTLVTALVATCILVLALDLAVLVWRSWRNGRRVDGVVRLSDETIARLNSEGAE